MAPLQFGILEIPYQLSDVTGPLDVLCSSSRPYLSEVQVLGGFPKDLANSSYEIDFHYIGESLDKPETHTATCKIQPSTTMDDCPKLDYLLVGGPGPAFFSNVPESYAKFLRERANEVKTVFSTCTGGVVLASVGLLDGVNATTNHQVIGMAKQMRPQVNWTDEKQWVVDGKFWTAGGACAGMDMFAHWVKSNYGQEIAEAGWGALDYEPRDVNAKPVPLKNGLHPRNHT